MSQRFLSIGTFWGFVQMLWPHLRPQATAPLASFWTGDRSSRTSRPPPHMDLQIPTVPHDKSEVQSVPPRKAQRVWQRAASARSIGDEFLEVRVPVLDVRFLCVCVRACVCVRVCICCNTFFFHSARSHVPRPRATVPGPYVYTGRRVHQSCDRSPARSMALSALLLRSTSTALASNAPATAQCESYRSLHVVR